MNEKYFNEYCDYILSDIGFLKDEVLYDLGISYEEYMNPDERIMEILENYKDMSKRKK